jgi:titin
LSWNDASSTATGFEIYRATAGSVSFYPYVTLYGTSATSYPDTGLSEGMRYDYEVRSLEPGQPSNFSDPAGAFTWPATPSPFTAIANGSSEIDLSWVNQSASATGFEVDRSTDGVHFDELPNASSLSPGQFTYSDTGLSEGSHYYYEVRALGAVHPSTFSSIADTYTAANAPSNLAAVADTSGSVTVSWTNNSSVSPTFLIERSSDNGASFSPLGQTAAGVYSYPDSNTSGGTMFIYRVRAINAIGGASDPSNTQSAYTAFPLSAYTTSDTQIELWWSHSSPPPSGTFHILRSTDGTHYSDLTDVVYNYWSGTQDSFTDTALSQDSHYWYQIIANGVDTSAVASADVWTAPSAPQSLAAQAINPAEIDLSWTNVANDAAIYVERAPSGTNAFTPVQPDPLPPGSTSYQDHGVAEATAYDYIVYAAGTGGNSFNSNTATATTPYATPTNLHADAITANEVDLSWTTNCSSADTIHIDRVPLDANDNMIGSYAAVGQVDGSASIYHDTTVSDGTRYQYVVYATVNGADTNNSNAAAATTPFSLPSPDYSRLAAMRGEFCIGSGRPQLSLFFSR